jgi:hypothetical protein
VHIQISWRNLIEREHLKDLGHGCLNFLWARAKVFFGAGSRAAHGKITRSGIPNRLSYCKFFVANTESTNVAGVCRCR